jgi:hypothetical protein
MSISPNSIKVFSEKSANNALDHNVGCFYKVIFRVVTVTFFNNIFFTRT